MSHLSVAFPYAPTDAHKKRDHARAEIVKIFTKVIRARRASSMLSLILLHKLLNHSNHKCICQ
jgi:cytochrome P450